MEANSTAYINSVPRAEFWHGVRNTTPLMVGVVPFGITFGIMGLTAGLTSGETLLMSLVVFAGAAQFITVSMLAAGIHSWGMIVCTTLLINLRHLLMGASLAPYLGRLPLGVQALLAFGMADETYAVTVDRIHTAGYRPVFQLGSNITGYVAWAAATGIGVTAGKYIANPLVWGLDFAMPAAFLTMLLPRLVDRASLAVALAAAITAVIGALYLPGKWYIILACAVGCLTGGLLERGRDNED